MRHRLLTMFAALVVMAPIAAQTPSGQSPWKPKNLKYFPQDITREKLTQRMREFSFALGVRCQYCHAGGDGVSFEGVDFSSDEKSEKVKARAMLRMVDQVNGTLLAQLPSRAEPRVIVDCVTCHRGLPLPKTLQTTLFEIVEKDGAARAVEKYRELRREASLSGRYNFGEWEINELARRLAEANNASAAITILEMNGEFYPKSPEIDFALGELHRTHGERDQAIQRYRVALEKAPQHMGAKRRLEEMEKQ
jgi:Photosynthetic reaction centre cytochrome C subunit